MAEWTETAEHYLDEARKLHRKRKFWSGKKVLNKARMFREIIDKHDCRSVLDYGCGKGHQYIMNVPDTDQTFDQFLGVPITRFDPAVSHFSTKPEGTFDLVICCDVVEHVHEEGHEWLVEDLYGYADKVLYVNAGLRPSKKVLLTGENAHVAQKDAAYWEALFDRPRRCELILGFH